MLFMSDTTCKVLNMLKSCGKCKFLANKYDDDKYSDHNCLAYTRETRHTKIEYWLPKEDIAKTSNSRTKVYLG